MRIKFWALDFMVLFAGTGLRSASASPAATYRKYLTHSLQLLLVLLLLLLPLMLIIRLCLLLLPFLLLPLEAAVWTLHYTFFQHCPTLSLSRSLFHSLSLSVSLALARPLYLSVCLGLL